MQKLFYGLVLFIFFNYNLQLSANEVQNGSSTSKKESTPKKEIINEEDYDAILIDDKGNILEDSDTQTAGKTIQELGNKLGKKSSLNMKKVYHSENIILKKGEKVKAMYGGTILEIDVEVGKKAGEARVMRLELFNGDELVVTGVNTKGTELKIGDKVQAGDYLGVADSDTVEIRLLSVSK